MTGEMTKEQAQKLNRSGGGMTKEKFEGYASSCGMLKADMDEIRGELGAKMKDFEESGGNKKAFKLAMAVKKMEDAKIRDFLSSLDVYLRYLGVYDQADMFNELPDFGQPEELEEPSLSAEEEAEEERDFEEALED